MGGCHVLELALEICNPCLQGADLQGIIVSNLNLIPFFIPEFKIKRALGFLDLLAEFLIESEDRREEVFFLLEVVNEFVVALPGPVPGTILFLGVADRFEGEVVGGTFHPLRQTCDRLCRGTELLCQIVDIENVNVLVVSDRGLLRGEAALLEFSEANLKKEIKRDLFIDLHRAEEKL